MADFKGRNEITPQELKQALDLGENLELVDVRNFDEFQALRMRKSRFITLPELPLRINEIDREKPIVTFCKAGVRGKQAQELLAANGISAVNLQGGIDAWRKAGFPVIEEKVSKKFSVDQQTRMAIGILILVGLFFNKILWWLPWFVGIMLVIAGITDSCMMRNFISALPCNKNTNKFKGICSCGKDSDDHK